MRQNYTHSINGLKAADEMCWQQGFYKKHLSFITRRHLEVISSLLLLFTLLWSEASHAQRQMEKLNRGVVAVKTGADQVYIGWRLLGTDPADVAFNVYRGATRLNDAPISEATNFIDSTASGDIYSVKAVINGIEEESASTTVINQPYLHIPLQIPPSGITPAGEVYTYSANDASVGDLDGDGEYEIVLKWDPSNAKDNSQSGYTGNVYIDAYKLNGTRLWRIDLGRNIRAGAHYTQIMVYDLDGDGRAEVACRTADGTIDGTGVMIGNPLADYRNSGGYVLQGPEYLTIFNGLTGRAMASADHIPARGDVCSWGNDSADRPECYGNRVDRFVSAVAYLDGRRPTLIIGRGYYDKLVRAAWDWRDGQLTLRWVFDSKAEGNNAYSGQGNHQMTVGDVDGDGKDEIINGSSAIDDNGTGLWSNGLGHADALHMSDLDPDRPGQEIWMPFESPAFNGNVGSALLDAATGAIIWKRTVTSGDIGRGIAADIDPDFKGCEMWAAGSTGGVFDSKGNQIASVRPSINFGVWWDADLSRELLDGNRIDKWNSATKSAVNIFTATGNTSNNGTKATPSLSADILGDWREEVIWRTTDNTALQIYTTTIPASNRFYTLMHDSQYRLAIAWQNSAYNQPPHTSFYIGTDMMAPPVPSIEIVESTGIGDGHYLIKPVHSGLCLMADDTLKQHACDSLAAQVWRITKHGDFYDIYAASAKKFVGFEPVTNGTPLTLTNEASKKLFRLMETGEGKFQLTPSSDSTLALEISEADGMLYLSASNTSDARQQFTFAFVNNLTDCNGDWGGTAFRDNCSLCVGGNTGRAACDQSLPTDVYNIRPASASFCLQASDTVTQQTCDGSLDSQVWHITNTGSAYEIFSREAQKYLGYTSAEEGAQLILTTAKTQFIMMKSGGNRLLSPAANLDLVIAVQGDATISGQPLQFTSARGEASEHFVFEKVTTNIDCNGVWKGGAFIDNCGVCAAGNTGRQPCVTTLVSGRYNIRPVHSLLCLAPGTTLTQQTCDTSEPGTQEWRLNKVGSFYEISSVSTGQFLTYSSPTSGAALNFSDASDRKLFRIEVAPTNGSFYIYPSDNINVRFDVARRSVSPGAAVTLFNNGTNTNQRFYLEFKPEQAEVIISDISKTYTGLPASLTVSTIPPGLPVTVTYNGSDSIPTDAGHYVVAATVQDSVYSGSAQDTLIIHKAMLHVAADDKSRPFAEETPPLTITYSGFVNGENSAVLDSLPFIFTSAIRTSPEGNYPIEVGGAMDNNYEFSYENGTLIVFGQPVLKAQYRIRKHENRPYDNHIKPHFQILNAGSQSVKYSDLTLRYWYTKEGTAAEVFWCDYAALGTSKVKGNFFTMDSTAQKADHYLEISFTSEASLNTGKSSGEIQTRFNKVNWSDYNEKNDYSYDPAKTSYADWENVTLYYKGVLIWGNEPSPDGNGGEEPAEEVTVYPNPFQDTFTIKVEGPFIYSIFDQSGMLKEIGRGKDECTAGSRLHRSGLYHLVILHGEGLFSAHVVKE